MRGETNTRAIPNVDVAFRAGSVADIDALCSIDLETGALFEQAGLTMDFSDDHEYSLHERSRWLRCLEARAAVLAVDESGSTLGFAILGELDEEPYLEQLSVRMTAMRRGIGTALLLAAAVMARDHGGRTLWLTTYGHLPWNKPFYERHGFTVAQESECRESLTREVEFQRRWLPQPEYRVVMRKPLIVDRS